MTICWIALVAVAGIVFAVCELYEQFKPVVKCYKEITKNQ